MGEVVEFRARTLDVSPQCDLCDKESKVVRLDEGTIKAPGAFALCWEHWQERAARRRAYVERGSA